MKTTIYSTLLSLILTVPAFGQSRQLSGSQCGLTDMWGGGDGEEVWTMKKSNLNLSEMTEVQLSNLPSVAKEQILITRNDGSSDPTDSVVEAVKDLKNFSEGSELYLVQFSVKGKAYSSVLYYPGGNAVGLIFDKNTNHIVAENGDDLIACR